jgi:magnesium transporter
MTEQRDYLQRPVLTIARQDVVTLNEGSTVRQALDDIRSHALGDRIVYFYVVDNDRRLSGVVPTRRLLITPLEQQVSAVMVRKLVTIREEATIFEAHELLARHKLLAVPVVDHLGHVLGVVDAGMLLGEDFEMAERERTEEIYEAIGFRVSQVRDASPVRAFRFRFPWLVATIGGGLVCAMLANAYEVTLGKSLVLVFFLALVLGLGESVSMQSMTVAIQALRSIRPTLRWYVSAFRREVGTALLLGVACGFVVGCIVWLWSGAGLAAIVIGGSILLALCAACFFGLSVPALLHALRLDPKISAGPVTLAITDVCTILLYFGLAAVLL